MLEISHVGKKFAKLQALQDVTFDVKDGSKCLLIGSNGAGKTTLVKCIVGLLRYSGVIRVDGLDALSEGKKARGKIGYVPQAFNLYDKLAVEEQAHLTAKLKGVGGDSIESNLRLMDMWDARRKRVGELSHGMRQRLSIALALFGDPALLIFDEPLSSIDLKGRLEFESILRRVGEMAKTVLISTHLPGLSGAVETAVIIDRGRVVAKGSPRELLTGIGSKDKLYLKFTPNLRAQAQRFLSDKKLVVETEGEWLRISVDSNSKMEILDSLVRGGYKMEDMVVEPSTIESAYVDLIGSVEQPH